MKTMKNTIPIILRGEGTAIEYQLWVALDSEVSNFRLNAQTLVGFDDQMCKLILHRTGLPLVDSLRFEETALSSGDILTVVPFVSPPVFDSVADRAVNSHSVTQPSSRDRTVEQINPLLVSYRLIPLINGMQPGSASYVIQLQPAYENKPVQFFRDYGGQEQKQLEVFLAQQLKRNVSIEEMDRVIQIWCEDISVGYQETKIKLD